LRGSGAQGQFDATLARRLPLRILLAEDNTINQKLALKLLEKMGYRADVAANGLEVLEALGRQPYDVVLMDMQMPEMDGLEATRSVREGWPEEEQPRIIAMTANAMQGDREACLAAGMNDYISKPIQIDDLQEALRRCGAAQEALLDAPPVAATANNHARVEQQPSLVVDWGAIARLQSLQSEGEPDLVAQFIDLFLEETPGLLASMRAGLAQQSSDHIRRAAHTLKSTSADLGAIAMMRLCAELEKKGRRSSLEGSETLVTELEQEFDAVSRELQKWTGEIADEHLHRG
nr:response regulator [Ardenticatenales bacterium]